MKCVVVGLGLLSTVAGAFADGLDQFIHKEMAARDIPGLALTVVQSGVEKKTAAYGLANIEWGIPATTDTVFEVGSITKQFTAAAILLLVEDGKLALEDSIIQHLPGAPRAWKPVTVRHLLSHTGGVKTYTGLDGFELAKRLTQEQFIAAIGVHPLDFQPGEAYKYSNSGYNLLGYIIENLSGRSYWEFLGERIFLPLGMTATTDREPRNVVPKRAGGYERDKARNLIHRDFDLTDIWAAGAIVSTVGDLAKWNAALDGESLLSLAGKEQMWTPATLNDGSSTRYGLGWQMDDLNGHRIIGHSGSTAGFSASLQRFPAHDLTVIVLCNSSRIGMAAAIGKGIAQFHLPGGETARKD